MIIIPANNSSEVKPQKRHNEVVLPKQPKITTKNSLGTPESGSKKKANLALMTEKDELSDVFAKRSNAVKIGQFQSKSNNSKREESVSFVDESTRSVHKGIVQ